MNEQDIKPDVAIIGAGPAGCSAAYALTSSGKRVALIERLDRVGGLARTIPRQGARYDIGPHRFFTKADRVLSLWREVGRDQLIDVPRLTRILYRNRLLHYPLRPLNALMGLGPLRSVNALGSYVQARARSLTHPRPPQSFEDWVTAQFGRVLYENFFRTYTEKVWGIPCAEIGAEWASQRIKGLSLPQAILNALTHGRTSTIKTLVDHFLYCRTGAGAMYETMAATVVAGGGRVATGEEVTSVEHDGRGRVEAITTRTLDGATRTRAADTFISTMPITQLAERLSPSAPATVIEAARRLRYRTHISVNLLVRDNPFPDNWIYVHAPEVQMGRMANYRNFAASMCPDGELTPLTVEYFTFDGDAIASLTDGALIDLALREGRRVGLLDARPPEDAFVVRSPHAYCVIQRGYEASVNCLREYFRGFANLQTAGRAGMFKYNNQDHSIMTGLLAADNVGGVARDLWSVNIDAEYHESGTAPDLCEEDRQDPGLK